MAGTRKLSIEILGDANGAAKAFGQADKAADGFGSSIGKVGKMAALGFAGVAGAAVAAGVVVSKWAGDAAADASEQALFEKQVQLAGGTQQVIDAFDEQIAAGMRLKGFTDTDLRGAYAQAYSNSQDMATATEDVALAMDIARKTGVPLETALDAVTKAQNGNAAALKKMMPEYGALIDGAGSSAEALDLVRDATSGMADTFANTAEGRLARSKIQFDEIKETIGAGVIPIFEALLPPITAAMEWIGVHLPAAMEVVKAWVSENWPVIRDGIMVVVDQIRVGIEGFVGFVTDIWNKWGDELLMVVNRMWPPIWEIIKGAVEVIRGVIKTVTDLIRGDWEGAWEGVKQIVFGLWETIKGIVSLAIENVKATISLVLEGIAAIWGDTWNGIASSVDAIWEDIKGFVTGGIDAVVGFVTELPGRITGKVAGAFDGIKDAFKSAINWVIDKWNSIDIGIDIAVPSWVPGVGGKGFKINDMFPDIPRLHTGGIAGGMSFGSLAPDEVAAVLRRGETVLTPDQLGAVAGSGGTTHVWNITPPPMANDPVAYGLTLIETILQAERATGPVFTKVRG